MKLIEVKNITDTGVGNYFDITILGKINFIISHETAILIGIITIGILYQLLSFSLIKHL